MNEWRWGKKRGQRTPLSIAARAALSSAKRACFHSVMGKEALFTLTPPRPSCTGARLFTARNVKSDHAALDSTQPHGRHRASALLPLSSASATLLAPSRSAAAAAAAAFFSAAAAAA